MRLLPPLLLLSLAIPMPVIAQNTTPITASPNFWQASVLSEGKKDYVLALSQLAGFQQAGGDPFLFHLRAGWLDYLNQDYKSAKDNYDAALRLQPSSLNALLGLLDVAQAQADAAEIRKAADGILHLDPLNYRAQMADGAVQFKAQDYRQALSYYRRVMQYYPDDLAALSGQAWSLYYLDQARAAAACFQTLLSVEPGYPEARQGLALAQAKSTAQLTQTL